MDTERTFIRSLWLSCIGGTDMGAEALEKVSLYWLCHLPEAGLCRYVGSESWQAVSEKHII